MVGLGYAIIEGSANQRHKVQSYTTVLYTCATSKVHLKRGGKNVERNVLFIDYV